MKRFLLLLAYISLGACTDNESTTRVLEDNGYTNIELTGWKPLQAGKDDVFSTGFTAKSPNGRIVSGAVTKGVFKGSTIRFD